MSVQNNLKKAITGGTFASWTMDPVGTWSRFSKKSAKAMIEKASDIAESAKQPPVLNKIASATLDPVSAFTQAIKHTSPQQIRENAPEIPEIVQKSLFKGAVAAPLSVALTQPAIVANKRVQLGNEVFPKDVKYSANFPTKFGTFYAGAKTSVIGKFPSQLALLGSHELYTDLFSNFVSDAAANTSGAVCASITQNLVKAPFSYIEHLQHQSAELKAITYLSEKKKTEGVAKLLKSLYSGVGAKIAADVLWYPSYTFLSKQVIKEEDSVLVKMAKAALIGGVSAFFSYPVIRVQTQCMENAKENPNNGSVIRAIKSLLAQGRTSEGSFSSRMKSQLEPFYRGGKIAVFGITPLQAVAYQLITLVSQTIFDKKK